MGMTILLKSAKRIRGLVLPVLGLAGTLIFWFVAAQIVGPLRLPSPFTVLTEAVPMLFASDVLAAQFSGSGGIGTQLLISLSKVVTGTVLGVLLGTALGLVMTYSRRVGWFLDIPTTLLRAIPPLALVPFILIWFGTGLGGDLLLVSLYVGLISLANTLNSATNVPVRHEKFAASLGASRSQIFRHVVVPAVIPELLGSLRITFAFAWGLLVVAESLGGVNGIGQVLTVFVSLLNAKGVLVSILWVVVLATLIDKVLLKVFASISRWAEHDSVRNQ